MRENGFWTSRILLTMTEFTKQITKIVTNCVYRWHSSSKHRGINAIYRLNFKWIFSRCYSEKLFSPNRAAQTNIEPEYSFNYLRFLLKNWLVYIS